MTNFQIISESTMHDKSHENAYDKSQMFFNKTFILH